MTETRSTLPVGRTTELLDTFEVTQPDGTLAHQEIVQISKVPFPNSQLARHHERLLKEDEELMELLTIVLSSRILEE